MLATSTTFKWDLEAGYRRMCFKHMQTMYCGDDLSDYEPISPAIKLHKRSISLLPVPFG